MKVIKAWEKERSWDSAEEGSATQYNPLSALFCSQWVKSRVLPTRRRPYRISSVALFDSPEIVQYL